ncbi:hypothetical protein C8R43DRAFT_1117297 [Mycena crocata]|nr:hypothetical protein C8R43DRAFT_1117297 [Mycena crocata]
MSSTLRTKAQKRGFHLFASPDCDNFRELILKADFEGVEKLALFSVLAKACPYLRNLYDEFICDQSLPSAVFCSWHSNINNMFDTLRIIPKEWHSFAYAEKDDSTETKPLPSTFVFPTCDNYAAKSPEFDPKDASLSWVKFSTGLAVEAPAYFAKYLSALKLKHKPEDERPAESSTDTKRRRASGTSATSGSKTKAKDTVKVKKEPVAKTSTKKSVPLPKPDTVASDKGEESGDEADKEPHQSDMDVDAEPVPPKDTKGKGKASSVPRKASADEKGTLPVFSKQETKTALVKAVTAAINKDGVPVVGTPIILNEDKTKVFLSLSKNMKPLIFKPLNRIKSGHVTEIKLGKFVPSSPCDPCIMRRVKCFPTALGSACLNCIHEKVLLPCCSHKKTPKELLNVHLEMAKNFSVSSDTTHAAVAKLHASFKHLASLRKVTDEAACDFAKRFQFFYTHTMDCIEQLSTDGFLDKFDGSPKVVLEAVNVLIDNFNELTEEDLVKGSSPSILS